MNSNKFAILALLGYVRAADQYDYADHGNDWDINFPGCGDSNQSPINLLSMGTSRNNYGYYVYGSSLDELQKRYENQVDATVK